MEIKEYSIRVENNRSKLKNEFEDIIHMVLGMLTELGELADVFKKCMAYDKEIDWVNVKEEMGDIMWYFIGLCNILDVDFYEILDINAKKLATRYKNGFTKEEAELRNLDKEREILEANNVN